MGVEGMPGQSIVSAHEPSRRSVGALRIRIGFWGIYAIFFWNPPNRKR